MRKMQRDPEGRIQRIPRLLLRHGGIQSTKCSSFIENRYRGRTARQKGRTKPVFLLDLARA